ncbi:MAG: pilus assembly protein PilP [Pseudomonadota bacterium]|nr:pilus assembly protein PilP [Pseudomonadota bacterium]
MWGSYIKRTVILLSGALLLVGCGAGGKHQDLVDYIEETKRRPVGQIKPLPPFVPYKSFSYGAMTLRSPFDQPVYEQQELIVSTGKNVKPDFNREKEYLEEFNLAVLSMVGILERGGERWALIDDGEGGIHRVKEGNYMGRNHGRIVATSNRNIDIIEIVPDGKDGWVERPKAMQIVEKE